MNTLDVSHALLKPSSYIMCARQRTALCAAQVEVYGQADAISNYCIAKRFIDWNDRHPGDFRLVTQGTHWVFLERLMIRVSARTSVGSQCWPQDEQLYVVLCKIFGLVHATLSQAVWQVVQTSKETGF